MAKFLCGGASAAGAVSGDLLVDRYSPLFGEDAPEHASPQARQALEARPDPGRVFGGLPSAPGFGSRQVE